MSGFGKHRHMSLSLAVLTPGSAETVEQALDVYYERVEGQPDEATLQAFADELNASYDDDNWPFAGDPIVGPSCVELTIAWDAWDQEAQRMVGTAHRYGLVVLDPQEEQLIAPDSFAVSWSGGHGVVQAADPSPG